MADISVFLQELTRVFHGNVSSLAWEKGKAGMKDSMFCFH